MSLLRSCRDQFCLRSSSALVLLVMLACMTAAQGQTVTLSGTWTNTTFNSSGTVTITATAIEQNLSFTFDMNGGVFGAGDPPAVTLQGTFGPNSVVLSKVNDPFYGDMTIEIGFDGSISIVFDNVPAEGIDRVEATGHVDGNLATSPDAEPPSFKTNLQGGFADTAESGVPKVNYAVFFSGGGGTALGNVEAEQDSGPTPQRLFFAQVGNGGGITSDIVLPNPTDQGAGVVISFAGDDGKAAPSGVGPEPFSQQSTVVAHISPLGSLTVSTNGQGDLIVGSATVISDQLIGGVIRFDLQGVGIVGVGASEPLSAFIVPVRSIAGGIKTGVALRNTSTQMATLTLELRRFGALVATAAPLQLPAGGHTARFIDELFPGVDVDDFVGAMVVRVADGRMVAATALELGPNPGQFTALPVTPLP